MLTLIVAIGGASVKPKARQHAFKSSTMLEAPTMLPPTNVSEEGLDANWTPVSGADAHCIYLFSEHVQKEDGEFEVLYEDFNTITFGTVNEPVWGETYESLDGYTFLPDWSIYLPSYIKGMVSGIVFSPYMDLCHDGGKFTVEISVMSDKGDTIYVTSHDENGDEEEIAFEMTDTYVTKRLEFTNGTIGGYLSFINQSATYYIDRVVVTQQLKAGEKGHQLIALAEIETNGSATGTYRFNDLQYAYGETNLAYTGYAVTRVYNDPMDEYDYDQFYSPYADWFSFNIATTDLITGNSKPCTVHGDKGGIVISTENNAIATLYTIEGKLLKSIACNMGVTRTKVDAGIYLLRVGGECFKVIVD